MALEGILSSKVGSRRGLCIVDFWSGSSVVTGVFNCQEFSPIDFKVIEIVWEA